MCVPVVGVQIVQVACGQQHTLAITHQGGLVAWGAAEFGQLGHGDVIGIDLPHPRMVKAVKHVRFASVSAGGAHSLALASTGHVYSFGQGTFGALGLGTGENAYVPTRVERLWSVGIVQVHAEKALSFKLFCDTKNN
jgi:alpha-tubulin suppressor-like RCC1 family protein